MSLAKFKQARDKYLEQVQENGQEIIAEVCNEYFDTHTKCQIIAWTQYTPHFNDGDACEFGVREYYGSLSSYLDEDAEDTEDTESESEMPDMSEYEDVLKAAFGDGQKIVVVRPKKDAKIEFIIEHYDHD